MSGGNWEAYCRGVLKTESKETIEEGGCQELTNQRDESQYIALMLLLFLLKSYHIALIVALGRFTGFLPKVVPHTLGHISLIKLFIERDLYWHGNY